MRTKGDTKDTVGCRAILEDTMLLCVNQDGELVSIMQ